MANCFSTLSLLFSHTDEEAMCRVRTHDDHGEFARLMARWEKPIRNLCVRMTGDIHRGEDLKQETFARLFEKRKEYEPTGRFSTYLWRMALNLCYDELRRRERRRESFHQTLNEESEEMLDQSLAESSSPDAQA